MGDNPAVCEDLEFSASHTFEKCCTIFHTKRVFVQIKHLDAQIQKLKYFAGLCKKKLGGFMEFIKMSVCCRLRILKDSKYYNN